MSGGTEFDPEATMVGFEAQRGTDGTSVAPPPREPLPATRRARPRKQPQNAKVRPPFGSRRGSRVAYTLYLPRPLADRLDRHLDATAAERTTPGTVAVEAIRKHWHVIHEQAPDPNVEIFGKDEPGALDEVRSGDLVRTVFYVTASEADAIELVRLQLGGCDLQDLHARALNALLADDGPPHD